MEERKLAAAIVRRRRPDDCHVGLLQLAVALMAGEKQVEGLVGPTRVETCAPFRDEVIQGLRPAVRTADS